MQSQRKIILTTEKDAMRLAKFDQDLLAYPFYVIPIEVRILFNEEQAFTGLIGTFIAEFKSNKDERFGSHKGD